MSVQELKGKTKSLEDALAEANTAATGAATALDTANKTKTDTAAALKKANEDESFKESLISNPDETLKDYDEIILIGSGKGVASVNVINNTKWRRKSLKYYRILIKIYQQAVIKCPRYNG